jgi:putative membrane protein
VDVIRLLLRLAANVAALWVAAELLAGVAYRDTEVLILAGVVLTLVNWAVRPVVTILAIPFIVLTLGLGLFAVNLLMLLLTSWLVDGFRVHGFWAAVAATAIAWAVNAVFAAAAHDERRRRGRGRRAADSVRA